MVKGINRFDFRKDRSNCFVESRLEDTDLETGKSFISVYCDNLGKSDGYLN